MTPKPILKPKPPAPGTHKVAMVRKWYYTIQGGWLVTHYEAVVNEDGSHYIDAVWTEEGGGTRMPIPRLAIHKKLVEQSMKGEQSLSWSNQVTRYPDTWCKLVEGSSWWVASDRDMLLYPELREHLMKLWESGGSDVLRDDLNYGPQDYIYDAYKLGSKNLTDPTLGLSWTQWSDIEAYRDEVHAYNCSRPGGTDGYR